MPHTRRPWQHHTPTLSTTSPVAVCRIHSRIQTCTAHMQVRHISGQRQCTGVRRSALSVAMESGNMSAAPAVDEDTYATSPRKFVLKALDGAEVMLGPERAMRSRLLWSMPASSDTVEFNVPFCKREVHCWLKAMDANSNESCTDCVAAVKVSRQATIKTCDMPLSCSKYLIVCQGIDDLATLAAPAGVCPFLARFLSPMLLS